MTWGKCVMRIFALWRFKKLGEWTSSRKYRVLRRYHVDNNPINRVDPLGLYWLEDLSNFSAGFGDTITFGGTRWIRQQLDYDDVVNPCSGYYTGGSIAGIGASLVLGELAFARWAQLSFSRQSHNIFRIISKRFKWGARIDKPHRNLMGDSWFKRNFPHPHFWKWR